MLPRPFAIAAVLLGSALGVVVQVTDLRSSPCTRCSRSVLAFTVVYARWDERHRS